MYIIDNNVFSNLFKFVRIDSFPTFWYSLDYLMEKGEVISIREVYRELESFFIVQGKEDLIIKWLKNHKQYFLTPTAQECEIVREIFKSKHNQQLIKKASLVEGKPEADVFIIAKAISEKAMLVTDEKYKVNGSKIPNVCSKYDVDYINRDEFAKIVNSFFDKELKEIYYSL